MPSFQWEASESTEPCVTVSGGSLEPRVRRRSCSGCRYSPGAAPTASTPTTSPPPVIFAFILEHDKLVRDTSHAAPPPRSVCTHLMYALCGACAAEWCAAARCGARMRRRTRSRVARGGSAHRARGAAPPPPGSASPSHAPLEYTSLTYARITPGLYSRYCHHTQLRDEKPLIELTLLEITS